MKPLTYGSVCSGIEAASVAWEPLGWNCAFVSEIEPFARAVLKHRFTDVPLHGDFTTIGADDYGSIDLLVGGTPCQSFSVAGLRGGLDDERGNLALEFLRLADRKRPRWLVWENVPGVLSSNGGRDFGAILGGMVELGYGVAYRVLDAQYFGVPQRRRRVFVVGCLGDANRAAAVLFERASLSGHPTPRRKTRKDVAGTIGSRTSGGGRFGTDFELDGRLVPVARGNTDYVNAITSHIGGGADENMARDGWLVSGTMPPITTRHASHANAGGQIAVAFNLRGRDGGSQAEVDADGLANIRAASGGSSRTYVATSAVRRLTPVECERLQGFPDDWTAVSYRGKPAADGPRYRALGNSMAVPCMRWIGERIAMVDAIAMERVAPIGWKGDA